MSIQVNKAKCVSCGQCCDVCPGNLIQKDKNDKAYIKYPQECWGCTACVKECPVDAIKYHLGIDIGGKGGYLYTKNRGDYMDWFIVSSDRRKHQITINKKESNKY